MPNQALHEKRHLLIIEDDGYCHFFLTQVLNLESTHITAVGSGTKAYETASENDIDAIMINFEALSQKGLSAVRILHGNNNRVPIIVVSDRENVDFALEVLRAGAFDYLTKPFNNVARVEKAIRNAFLERDSVLQATELAETELMTLGLLGKSKRIKDLQKIITQIAPLNVNVLITGESGTGKELIARAIHTQSSRKPDSFFAMNCGAMPEGLVESILFGHEKGAFTGADQSHAGYMEKAHGGTLFLDEVSELSPKGQVALLRFLEEHEFVRVGGVQTMTSDVRIIASTNRDLEEEVAKNRFRADLYFRLNVVTLKAPTLKERREDIIYLADYFARRFCLINNLHQRKLAPQAANLLEKYDWPGNVRELENLMEGIIATLPVNKNAITSKDILEYSERIREARGRDHQVTPDSLVGQTYKQAIVEFEKTYLKALLEKHQGNVAKAARDVDIHPVTLHRKLRKMRET